MIDSVAVQKMTDSSQIALQPVGAKTDTTAVAVAPDTSSAKKALIEALTPIWKKRLDYKTFSGKARVHFEGPDDKQEFTANIRIKKDSAIWINASAFGITAARILITPDSIFMLMQLKKEYMKMALKDAGKILPAKVDFASLQHLILGEPLCEGVVEDAASFGGTWTLEAEDTSYIQRVTYNKGDTTIRTCQLRTRRINGPQISSQFGEYEKVGDRRISTQRVINIQNGADIYSLDMIFLKEDFDEQLEFPFSIPNSYSKAK
jgi:hypothetical protein